MPFKDELLRRLPEIVIGTLAGRLGGPQGLAQFQGGMQERAVYEDQRAQRDAAVERQAQLDEERRQQQALENTRASEADTFARQQALMRAIVESEADPTALASFYGVPAEQAQALAAPVVSRKERAAAVEFVKRLDADDRYKGYLETPESISALDETTVDWRGKQIKVKDIRALAQEPMVPPKPAMPNIDRRGFQTKDITVGGRRMLAGYDPDKNLYYAPGDTATPLTGDIQEYERPPQQAAGNLPAPVARRANQLADAFRNDPTVKRTNIQAEAVSFVDSLDPNSQNPADDQALIYAFAKAMDPDSVVREGEYAVVQRYAQSWLDNFGFNALRVVQNREFLTPQARANMKATIRKRYLAGKTQYDNIRRSFAQQINRATGHQDGEEYLLDYGGAFPPATATVPVGGGGAAPVPDAGGDWIEIDGIRIRERK